MTSSVRAIPEGYHSVTPYLAVDDGARAIAFYKEAFGAIEVMRMPAPGGKVGPAEIRIGDSHIMLADEYPDMGLAAPEPTAARRSACISTSRMLWMPWRDGPWPPAPRSCGR